MKIAKYIQQDFIAPADLETLGNTYNTLETGHQEAIKAASNLKASIAVLPMNKSEDGFKAQLLNEIENTIANNTIYGNSYAALDDITKQTGDIASDIRVTGRIRSQQDYMDYVNKINNDTTLPQAYKDYYLENNPYHHEDYYDNNGKVIGTSKWLPKSNPTTVIDKSKFIAQGIKWAAEESGQGNITRWLDSNGRVTTDPSQAVDGEVYNTTTYSWERLPKEKILQGIYAAIDATPGGRESLKQDYDVAVWSHKKNVAANNGKPIVSDITDDDGIILSQDEYNHKIFSSVAEVASYDRPKSITTYGKGLGTYLAARNQQKKADDDAKQYNQDLLDLTMSTSNNPVEVSVDTMSQFISTKNIAGKSIQDLYRELTGRKLVIANSNQKITNIEELLNNASVPLNNRIDIRKYVSAYNEAIDNINAYKAVITNSEDKAKFDFAARMQSGGKLIPSEQGGSEYDDEIINDINILKQTNAKFMKIDLSDKTSTNFNEILNSKTLNQFKNLGLEINGNQLIIPIDGAESILPLISGSIVTAEDKANIGFLPTVYQVITQNQGRISVTLLDENKNNIIKNNNNFSPVNSYGSYYSQAYTDNVIYSNIIRDIGKLYNSSKDIERDISDKYKINPENITVNSLNLDGQSFTEQYLLNQLNRGIITSATYNVNKTYFNSSFEQAFQQWDTSQTEMYVSEKGGVRRKVTDSGDRYDYRAEIIAAQQDNRIAISPSIVAGITNPHTGLVKPGYNVTIYPKADDDGKINPDDIKSFYLPDLYNETASKILMQDPIIKAWNTVTVVGETQQLRYLTEANSNPQLGTITLQGLGQGQFVTTYDGNTQHIDNEQAIALTSALNEYNAIKNIYLSGYSLTQQQRATIADCATRIGSTFNLDPKAVLTELLYDINN